MKKAIYKKHMKYTCVIKILINTLWAGKLNRII